MEPTSHPSALDERHRLLSPPPPALLPLVAAIAVALTVFACLRLQSDTDLWGHVRFGLDMIESRSLPSHDPYSFTSDIPWINHEWLAEVIMALAWRLAGSAGLVTVKVLLVSASLGLIALGARRAGTQAIGMWLCVSVVAFSGLMRTDHLRPQVFALCACAWLVFSLWQTDRWSQARQAASVGLNVAAWANVHGSWFIGATMVVLWSLGAWHAGKVPRRRVLLLPLVACLASLATPYGVSNWAFLADTVRFERPGITDWAPAWREPDLMMIWATTTAAAAWAAAGARHRRRPSAWLLPTAVLCLAALKLARVDLFFGCATAALLAESLATDARQSSPPSPPIPQAGARTAIACLMALAILAPWAKSLVRPVSCISIPSTFAEAGAIEALRLAPAGARILTYFDYGEYGIWHLAPGQRVSMDGRRETVYSAALIGEHFAFYIDPAAHLAYPDRLGATAIWVPAQPKFGRALRPVGWVPVFEGPVSTVWTRQGYPAVPADMAGARCFPGP